MAVAPPLEGIRNTDEQLWALIANNFEVFRKRNSQLHAGGKSKSSFLIFSFGPNLVALINKCMLLSKNEAAIGFLEAVR